MGSNILLAMTTYFSAAPTYGFVQFVLDRAFLSLFVVEMAMRLSGVGLRHYLFHNSWNCLDVVIVVGSLGTLGAATHIGVEMGKVFRLLRLVRAGGPHTIGYLLPLQCCNPCLCVCAPVPPPQFRVVRASNTLRVLFVTLFLSMRALLNVTLMLFLAICVYAVSRIRLLCQSESISFTSVCEYVCVCASVDWHGVLW